MSSGRNVNPGVSISSPVSFFSTLFPLTDVSLSNVVLFPSFRRFSFGWFLYVWLPLFILLFALLWFGLPLSPPLSLSVSLFLSPPGVVLSFSSFICFSPSLHVCLYSLTNTLYSLPIVRFPAVRDAYMSAELAVAEVLDKPAAGFSCVWYHLDLQAATQQWGRFDK